MPACAPQPAIDTNRLVPEIERVDSDGYNEFREELSKSLGNWMKSSAFLRIKYGLINVEEQIKRITHLAPGWDSYGAEVPTETAIANARRSLTELAAEQILPSTIVPSASGGVSAYFICEARVAYIESYNDGTQALVLYDQTGDAEVLDIGQELELAAVATKIAKYLG